MHPPRTAAPAALWIALALLPAARAGDALDDARARITRDPAGAVALLETALPGTDAARRPVLLALLREAYGAAAKQAEAAGRRDEAEEYRENLAILARSARATAPPAGDTPQPPATVPVVPAPITPVSEPLKEKAKDHDKEVALPVAPADPDVKRAVADAEPASQGYVAPIPAPTDTPAAPPEVATKPAAEPPRSPSPKPLAAPVELPVKSPEPAPTGPNIDEADVAFQAKKYDVAGSIYAKLDQLKALPADRRDHWAYCRAVDVVRRINARPTAASEWASIDAEIEQIRRLSPTNWFAEYLRNRAAERNPNAKVAQSIRANKVVVRGSSPEEAPVKGAPPKPTQTPSTPARAGALVPVPATTAPVAGPPVEGPQAAAPWQWSSQPVFTTNFQVVYPEGQRDLAEQVGKAAETARAALVKRWGEPNPGAPWSPRCEVLLFPTAAEYSRATGQPPESPGISTMRMTEGRIDGRRINLRADHANVVKAVLPHEVTHVVLADLFPHKQIPRWADEGMAVLSEPEAEQDVRAADLDEPLASGRLFRVTDLVSMDYPDPRYLSLYYAQSVSLTRFLVAQGSPAQFVKFVQQAQWSGFEPALKEVYQITSVADLQSQWLAHARAKTAPADVVTASTTESGDAPRR